MRHIGQLVISNGASASNLSTATPFVIPLGAPAIFVTPSATGLFVEAKPSVATFVTSATLGTALGTASLKIYCDRETGTNTVLAAYNNTGAPINLDVWVVYG